MKIPTLCRTALAAAIAFAIPLPAHAVGIYTNSDLLPLQTSFTVATCYSSSNLGGGISLPLPDPNGNVVVVWKTTPGVLSAAPMDAPASAGYNWQYYHNELTAQFPVVGAVHEWKASHMGEVFGVALSDQQPPNIFVSASTCYGYATWPGTNGPGTIYRLDANTGAITPLPQLPGAGGGSGVPGNPGYVPDAALGNLCFVRTLSGVPYLYVTNMGDGKIYRVTTAGAVSGTFDHGLTALPQAPYLYPAVADNPSLVFTPTKRRPWGIGYYCGRIYYSIFDSSDPAPPPLDPNANGPQCEIWSVAIDNAGNFVANSSVREFKMPRLSLAYSGFGPLLRSSMPVSDIEFTLAGSMIVAERYHTSCTSQTYAGYGFLLGAHSTRVLEYTGNTGAWAPSPQNKLRVGSQPWNNSAGGVGPACDGSVWCTGDALGVFQSLAAYGQQRIRGQGNAADITPLTQSHIIDYDCSGTFYGKSLIGDVDTVIEPQRVLAKMVSAVCPPVPGGPYSVTLSITNLMAVPMTQLAFGPCPPAFLPPGGVSLVPSPASMAMSLAPGATTNVTVFMTALPIGGVKCFSIQANPVGGGAGSTDDFLCSPKVCVRLPKCPCLLADLTNPLCPVYEGQVHSATLSITNLWNTVAFGYELLPCPAGDLPPGAVTLQPTPSGFQPFSPTLNPNTTSPPINVSFPGLPVVNTPTQVCFIVRLLPQNWEQEGPFCEAKVCITFPPCPPPLPCVTGNISNVQCPTAPPGNYLMNLTITNLGPVPAASATLTPCAPPPGGIPAIPSPPFIVLSPILAQNQSGTYPIQLGGVGTSGVLACFCLTLNDANGRPLCSTVVCKQLPPCPCATFSITNVQCPQYEGQPHTATVTVTNTGFQPLYYIGFTQCPPNLLPPGAIPGVNVSPAGIIPLGPLAPGNNTQIPITLTGIPKAGGIVCFNIGVFEQQENHVICSEKKCFTVAPCPPCLPCMNATATAAVCPVVSGGPFTTNVTITNLQPVPAATAQLIPCAQPGGVPVTPTPGSITLSPLLQNQSAVYPVSFTGGISGQTGCFCIRLLDANGNILCERPICLTLPFCPAPCALISPLDIACPQGGNGYNSFLSIFNQSPSTFFFYQTCPVPVGQLPVGAITGQPTPAGLTPLSPNIPSGGFGGAPVTLPNNLPTTGGTFCFIIKFFGQMDNLICQKLVCLTLPPCVCGAVLSHSVDCVQTPNGVKRQLTITVQNLTNFYGTPFNFDLATIAPGSGFSPAVITPSPNPIPPGGTGTLTTCYVGNKPPQCIQILLTNSARTKCCPLKLCPLWVECAQPETPDRCDLSSRIVADNASPVPTTAWIYNGSNTPKSYNFTITPVSVPGCTGTLPPVAFLPSSGVTLAVGAFSSLGLNFTISPASLLPGQCAGFRVCFQEVSPVYVPPVCCISKITRSNNTDPCIIWNPIGASIPVAAGLKTIIIKNPTSAVMPLDLMLIQSGGVELSLTGEFASADGSAGGGLGGPAPDYDAMPFSIVLGPHESVPLTFTGRVKADVFPGIGPGPKWTELQIIRLCNVLPNGGGGIDDPHTIAADVFHVPSGQPVSPALPLDQRDFGFSAGSPDTGLWTAIDTTPGEMLFPEFSENLHTFLPNEAIPFATVQAADGTLAGTGQPLWSYTPPRRGPRFIRIRQKD